VFAFEVSNLRFDFVMNRLELRNPHRARVVFQQLDREKTRRDMGVAFDAEFPDLRGHRFDGVVDVAAVGEHRHAVAVQVLQRFGQLLQQRPDAARLAADGADDGSPEIPFQLGEIVFQPLPVGLVAHVEGEQHRDMELGKLGGEIETPARNGGVDHVEDQVDPRPGQFLKDDVLLGGARRERVDARQVHQFNLHAVEREAAGLAFDRHAGVVADMLAGSGQGVEDAGLAAVGVARQRDAKFRLHSADSPRLSRIPAASSR